MPLTHSKFHGYVQPLRLPIYLEKVKTGRHPIRAWHDHDFTEIVVVLEGSALSLVDDQQSPITKGDVLVIHPPSVHAYDNTATLSIVNLCYHPNELPLPQLDAYAMPDFEEFFPLGEPSNRGRNPAAPVFHLNAHALQSISRLVERLTTTIQEKRPGYSFLGMALFMEIIAGLCQGERITPAKTAPETTFWLAGLLGYIRSHFQEELSVPELAHISHTSERTFFREFRTMTGYSPHEYQTKLRLQYAITRLSERRKPIEEIAREAGFCNGCHFSRHFKKAYGMTPLEYRRKQTPDSAK